MRVSLPEGYIYIVPSTAEVGQLGDFILSIYFSKSKSKVHFHRVDRPNENKFVTIKEESQNANAVPEWKIDLCEKRIKYMIFEEDDADQIKIELKKAPIVLKNGNFKLSSGNKKLQKKPVGGGARPGFRPGPQRQAK